jgi:hypothetical protein
MVAPVNNPWQHNHIRGTAATAKTRLRDVYLPGYDKQSEARPFSAGGFRSTKQRGYYYYGDQIDQQSGHPGESQDLIASFGPT